MLEFHKDCFVQMFREAPAKKAMFSAPAYSPYIQTLVDKVKGKEALDIASIDWSAIELTDVTPTSYGDAFERISNGWIRGFAIKVRKTPPFRLKDRIFF